MHAEKRQSRGGEEGITVLAGLLLWGHGESDPRQGKKLGRTRPKLRAYHTVQLPPFYNFV